MSDAPLIPKLGTLERLMLEKLYDSPNGVTYLDFVGTGITAENIDQIAQNLRTGVYVAENDDELKFDA